MNLSEKDYKRILLNYNLGKLKNWRIIKTGTVQKNCLIETCKGKFVIRFYNFRSIESIKFEINLINYILMGNVSYSAVVLDERSRERLIKRFASEIPDDWEIVAHHMTINLGELDPEYEKYIGMTVRLTVNDFGMDDKVAAVGVSGFDSKNAKPHITLAVN